MTHVLLQTMWDTLPEHARPPMGATVLIAASGGSDSTALCYLMRALSERRQLNWRLHLVHLDHGLRPGASAEDAGFVEDLARANGWEVHLSRHPQTGSTPAGLEETARNARYALFAEVAERIGAAWVATAHHADDQIETVLQRILRGTGLRGLGGIPVGRPLAAGSAVSVIRPLLQVSRRALATYLNEQGIDSRIDASNAVPDRTRNRLRHELLPHLEQNYNAGVRGALLRLAQQARGAHDYLRQGVDAALPEVQCPGSAPGEVRLDADALLQQPEVLQTELLRRMITELGVGEKKLTFDHLQAIRTLAARNVSGKALQLPGSLVVRYEQRSLILSVVSD